MKKTKTQYIAAEKSFIEFFNLKKGDKVKVLRKASHGEMGWGTVWTSGMNETVGEELTIHLFDTDEDGNGIYLDSGYWYPFFVLELIRVDRTFELESGEYTVVIDDNGDLSIGCQHVSYDLLKKIYDAATRTKNANQ